MPEPDRSEPSRFAIVAAVTPAYFGTARARYQLNPSTGVTNRYFGTLSSFTGRFSGLDEHVGGTFMNNNENDIPFIDIASTHNPL